MPRVAAYFRGIRETCLYVRDLNITGHFYHELLGLESIGHVAGRHTFFRAGSSVLLCFLSEATKKGGMLPAHGASGAIHFAFEVNPQDYMAARIGVSTIVEIECEQTWDDGLQSFYFRDPDGHLVEIAMFDIWK